MPPTRSLFEHDTVTPCADGVIWIPHTLPVHIHHAELGMTVAEWLGIPEGEHTRRFGVP